MKFIFHEKMKFHRDPHGLVSIMAFDTELWKMCCEREQVSFVSKYSEHYPAVLKRYRDEVAYRKTPAYEKEKQLIQSIREQQEQKKQDYRERVSSEAYLMAARQQQEAKRIQQTHRIYQSVESMSWGT